MLKSYRVRLIVILAALGISAFYLFSEGLKLGLDLQGGTHLVFEIDDPHGTLTPERRADAILRAERIIRKRVDQYGVEEPLIQTVGSERLIVELAGLADTEGVIDVLKKQAFLEWKLVLPNSEVDQSLERLDEAIVAAIGIPPI